MKKVNVAVVGLNFGRKLIDRHLLRGKGAQYFHLSAVCDHRKKLSDAAAAVYGVKAYYKLEDLLKDDEIPVIVLVTGPDGRADLLRQIIHAGKDCMTTKPFELDAAKAASVLAEARALGRFIHLNSPPPVDTLDFQKIREWREKYDLGMAVGGHHESWYKAVEEADGCWYDDPATCPAAPIIRLGIYGVNDLLRILGEPGEIQVMQTRLFTGRPTADYARMSIKFKSGAIADTLDGYVTSPERHESSLILYFERGTIYRNPPMLPGNSIRYDTVDSTYLCLCMGDKSDGMPIETVRIKNEELSLGYKWDVFHKAVTTRQRPDGETPDDVIINSLRIFGAIREASETGTTVKIARVGGMIYEETIRG